MLQNQYAEELLTARQAADFLKVHISTIRRWSRNGVLKSYQLGPRGDRRYRREDIVALLNPKLKNIFRVD